MVSLEATIQVRAGGRGRSYPVLVSPGLLSLLPKVIPAHAPAHRYAVITDSNVAPLYGRKVHEGLRGEGKDVELFEFPAGEASKSREVWATLTDAMLKSGFGRDSAVVAVGGGVTGDLAGFVAATFMRGVPIVQIPTTLVAMIDSSVGGKTGVDTVIGKNLVGAFHPPRLVAVDPDVSGTLPRDVRAQGLAEAVKHGAILDRAYLAELEKELPLLLAGDPGATARAVLRSIEIKSEVVSEDERESGLRQILNFGHTLGHAMESASDFGIPHGSAVALGMILEARLGESMGVTESGSSEILERVVRAMGLPTEIPEGLSLDEVLRFTQLDKKGRKGKPRYALLTRLGYVDPDGGWGREVPTEEVERVLGGS